MFTGTGTALVTPFRTDGSLDGTTLRALLKRQIDAGIDFLVPCGTTGESPRSRTKSICASSKSPSRRAWERFRFWRAPAVTTPAK